MRQQGTRDIAGMFQLYHARNPQVYQAFVRFARELKDSGRHRASSSLIFERMRWESMVGGEREIGLPKYRLNNNYRAFFARKLAAEDQSFSGFFETREQKSVQKTGPRMRF